MDFKGPKVPTDATGGDQPVRNAIRDASTHVVSNAKLFVVGALVLLILIPLAFIHGVVEERQSYSHQAKTNIAASWGQSQAVMGPVLVVPYRLTWKDEKNKSRVSQKYIYVLPKSLDITAQLTPIVRARGIYKSVLYRAALTMTGAFPKVTRSDLTAADPLSETAKIQWNKAFVAIGVNDLKGLQAQQHLTIGNTAVILQPGDGYNGLKAQLGSALRGESNGTAVCAEA